MPLGASNRTGARSRYDAAEAFSRRGDAGNAKDSIVEEPFDLAHGASNGAEQRRSTSPAFGGTRRTMPALRSSPSLKLRRNEGGSNLSGNL